MPLRDSDQPAAPAATIGRRPLRASDQLRMRRIRGARIAPDGDRVVYVVRSADAAADADRDQVWLASRDRVTGCWSSTALTPDLALADDPCWSPDGRMLAIVCRVAGVAQVHALDPLTGDTRPITRLPDGATDPVWSPDGTRLIVRSVGEDQQGVAEDPLVRHVTRLPFQTAGGAFIGDRFVHLWIVDLPGGEARQLTFGDHDEYAAAWSPDGRRIAFTSRRPAKAIAPLWLTDAFVIDVSEAGRPCDGADGARRVTSGVLSVGAVAWSPDGTSLTFSAQRAGRWLKSATGVWVVPADGSTPPVRVDRQSNRAIGAVPEIDTIIIDGLEPTWTSDGTGILHSASEAGRFGLYRTDVASGETVLAIGGDRAVHQVSMSRDGRLAAMVATDWTNPGDLHICSLDDAGAPELRITDLNGWLGTETRLVTPEILAVPTRDGRYTLDAWLFRPVEGDPDRPRPLVELMHGGPNGTFGPTFLFIAQLLASSGFNALLVNPRGGLGYGEDFDAALDGRQGENDEADLWDALDVAIASGGVDADRLGIHGHSYGGFMAAWMPGRTDRYRASVASAIMANFVTQSLTAFYGGSYDWTEDGEWPDMWEDPLEWWRRSPLSHVPRMRTPILFLLGEDDGVTRPGEHEQLFTALKARGVETEMVRFVGANHAVSSSGAPSVRVRRAQLIVDWFERFLGDSEAP